MNILNESEEKNPFHKYKNYQTTHKNERVNGKHKDILVKKETKEGYRKLANSGILEWKKFNTVLKVINRHPTRREEIVKEIEERY